MYAKENPDRKKQNNTKKQSKKANKQTNKKKQTNPLIWQLLRNFNIENVNLLSNPNANPQNGVAHKINNMYTKKKLLLVWRILHSLKFYWKFSVELKLIQLT